MPLAAQIPMPTDSQTWPSLRIWTPGQDDPAPAAGSPAEHRIPYPVLGKTRRKRDASGQQEIWPTAPMDPDVTAEAARLTAQFAAPTISETQRLWMRANLSLRGFYGDWMRPERDKAVLLGKLSRETISKDLQSINRWETMTRPTGWSETRDWPGIPIGATTGPILDHFLSQMKAAGYADGTILSTKNHLAAILHRAEKLRLVDPFAIEPPQIERFDSRSFSDSETVAAYQILRGKPLLRAAFVLALATGARPSDLFSLRWCDVRLTGVPMIRFSTEKTGVHLAIPLGQVATRHLSQLGERGEYLFPGLGSPGAKYPERATVSRRRTMTIKTLLFAAGVCDVVDGLEVEVEKPFQAARATAALWIERVGRGMSSVLLGHSDDDQAAKRVTRIHYLPTEMEPSPDLIDAVNRVKWPAEFSDGVTEK